MDFAVPVEFDRYNDVESHIGEHGGKCSPGNSVDGDKGVVKGDIEDGAEYAHPHEEFGKAEDCEGHPVGTQEGVEQEAECQEAQYPACTCVAFSEEEAEDGLWKKEKDDEDGPDC